MAEKIAGENMIENVPLVTVSIPVYNAGRHLRLAVLSIIGQTFADWELLIIDDGSTDNALESLSDIQDERIRIFRDGKNRGLAARLNESVDRARGRYFARMDQDDVSYPERFDRQVQALENDPHLDLVAVQAVVIDGHNRLTGMLPCPSSDDAISARPWLGFYLGHPTWMGRVEWFRTFRYREEISQFCEDQELLLRSYKESRFGIVREPLFAYRRREKIRWNRQIVARLCVLRIQVNHFLRNRQPGFALMAFLAYVGRSILDIVRIFSGISYPVKGIREDGMSDEWLRVLHIVQDERHDESL
ncbi:MAG: hypothetical protein AVO39_09235 [delta proteobacterium MLS_D]|jgi:glycosyltransferase involved in cell wall biosynthesis|nr:MAG: hypothetical protein AVO39_09235 [delta proteobacterium MLS_D]